MSEPTTEAGKRMLRWLDYHRKTGDPLPPNDEAAIRAIEQEARANADRELRDTALAQNKRIAQAVEDLTRYTRVTLPIGPDNAGRKVVYLDAVLALLEDKAASERKS